MTVFTKQVSQTGEKNFHRQTKMVTCGKGLLNFNNNLNNSLCTLIKSTKRISIDIYGKNILKLGKLCEKQVRILSHKLQDFADVCIMGETNLPPTIQTKVISKIQQLNKAISLLVSTKLLSDMFDNFTDFNPLSRISRQIQILQTDSHTFPYCTFHKHTNSKVQKALSQLRFWLPAIIITITRNEP